VRRHEIDSRRVLSRKGSPEEVPTLMLDDLHVGTKPLQKVRKAQG
jgi:hypothetical protein